MLGALAIGGSGCLNPIELEPSNAKYRAVIRWTDHGVPHILADDLGSAAYGQGYAFAKLNACILADQVLKVRSERAMFLGRGEEDEHVRSDLLHSFLGVYQKAEEGLPNQSQDVRDLVEGYAAGYNDYIAENAAELPCGEEPWLRPITSVDLFAHLVELGMLASARQAHEFIWAAQPPNAGLVREEPKGTLEDLRRRPGSNGWGIGADRSANGHGMLIANPHFPWEGELKLYESHLKIPGQLDVYGAGLMGVPGILIGFNENVAWTHTVSDGQRLTIYQLTIDPADPTSYIFDGQSRKMEESVHTVQVLEEDGSMSEASRTFYRTHQGPVAALPGLGWTPSLGFAIRDANENNQQMIAQFLGMNRAQSMDEFQRVHDEEQGIPWVNTMSTSNDGRAWYIDATPTPNLSQAAIDHWLVARESDILVQQLDAADLVLLPGDSSDFDWVEVDGARDPGLIPVRDVPRLERSDFIFNANDSHWLTNPDEPLEGYSPLHGFERTPRSPRTRMNATMLLDEDGAASGDDRKFDLDELRAAILNNRGMMAELLVDDVVARCQGVTTVPYGPDTVDISAACNALAGWDTRLDLDSTGALVWREFLGDFSSDAHAIAGPLFDVPFDPGSAGNARSAVTTPNTLPAAPDDPDDDRILEALAGATVRLAQAGIPADAPLRDAQYTVRSGQRIPIHGGGRNEGITNLIIYSNLRTTVGESQPRGEVINSSTDLSSDGYVINYGTSFIMAMQFTDDSPEAYAFLTYGQSDDPSSPYHTDQTKRFSEKDWRKILYTEEEIEADEALEVDVIFGFAPSE